MPCLRVQAHVTIRLTRHIHVEVLQEFGHAHHEDMLTTLRLYEVQRERRAAASAARERSHRCWITRNPTGTCASATATASARSVSRCCASTTSACASGYRW